MREGRPIQDWNAPLDPCAVPRRRPPLRQLDHFVRFFEILPEQHPLLGFGTRIQTRAISFNSAKGSGDTKP
jgi:hypothetical protein